VRDHFLKIALVFGLGTSISGPVPAVAQARMSGQSRPALSAADKELLKRVDTHYNQLASLRCRYVERYTGMGMTRSESGTLLLKKPGRMLWQYDSPAGKEFVLDGKFAYFFTPGDAQAQRIPAKELDDLRTPLRFLLGHTELARELSGITVIAADGGFSITGVPRGMEGKIQALSVTVTPMGVITGMKIEETDGATTDFAFSSIEENVPTRDGDFTFTAPAGVTIVNGGAPI
jgi:outer membrane lipoprotein carrier protein